MGIITIRIIMCIIIYILGIITIILEVCGTGRGRCPGTSIWTGAAGGTSISESRDHTTGIASTAENTTVPVTSQTGDETAPVMVPVMAPVTELVTVPVTALAIGRVTEQAAVPVTEHAIARVSATQLPNQHRATVFRAAALRAAALRIVPAPAEAVLTSRLTPAVVRSEPECRDNVRSAPGIGMAGEMIRPDRTTVEEGVQQSVKGSRMIPCAKGVVKSVRIYDPGTGGGGPFLSGRVRILRTIPSGEPY